MGNPCYKKIVRELKDNSVVFRGYPHRRHRKKPLRQKNNKSVLLSRIVDIEHKERMLHISHND